MALPQSDRSRALLEAYAPLAGVADELLTPEGQLRPVWSRFIDFLAGETNERMQRRFGRGAQYLKDQGVFYRQNTASASAERDWPLSQIPVLIHEKEWEALQPGIIQRAELLEKVVGDLYGPGQLVADGLLPPQLVAQNPEWMRPMVGITPRGGHFLHHIAFEIGRSPDGSWFVLGDRTQAPSGAGFAVENRMATSRIFTDFFPGANVKRLAGFFRAFRDALNRLNGNEGRVGILTPGSHTDTYFEHAYIARYLGFLLLECEDLKVEKGRLMVRTISGPEPISVLWRRLDSAWADPLELDTRSRLGTPGLVGSVRAGHLTMANALGSGVLESRAMLAFLPTIARKLLGEPLRLPNIATWWCGQKRERDYVQANAHRMLIGPALSTALPFDLDEHSALGGAFRGHQSGSLADWLSAEGNQLVGQEAVTLSTTPAWHEGKLVPRPMTVRVFAARTPKGWVVMPGGYARIGNSSDPTALAMRSGGAVADVWIVSDDPVEHDSLTSGSSGPVQRQDQTPLPARAADNLYWMGRYIERAEGVMRQMRAFHLRLAEAGEVTSPLLKYYAKHMASYGIDASIPVPPPVLKQIDFALGCAGKVRDRFSIDGWHALRDLQKTCRWMEERIQLGDDGARAMTVLLRKSAGFTGLVHENMFRFSGWRFLSIGRALERADRMCWTLAVLTDPEAPDGALDIAIEVGDSVMTHKRRFSVESTRETVIDLLALDGLNPRSILFQLSELKTQIDELPHPEGSGQLSRLQRQILRLHTDLAVLLPTEVTISRLQQLRMGLAELSDSLTATYLS